MAFKDVILTDIQEDYENLSLKTFVALVFKEKYCRETEWLLKLDPDTEVSVDNLIQLITLKEGMTNAIFGYLHRDPGVVRNSSSKWYIPFITYPNARSPTYPTGGAYLMSSDVPRKLIAAHMLCKYPYIPIEDMYFAGILAEAAEVRRLHLDEWRSGSSSRQHPILII
uniref:Hexosyltransferase n=1 Tax=Plectus sambesii TaxID=2011161 RepID=A0A914VK81_9BILA